MHLERFIEKPDASYWPWVHTKCEGRLELNPAMLLAPYLLFQTVGQQHSY